MAEPVKVQKMLTEKQFKALGFLAIVSISIIFHFIGFETSVTYDTGVPVVPREIKDIVSTNPTSHQFYLPIEITADNPSHLMSQLNEVPWTTARYWDTRYELVMLKEIVAKPRIMAPNQFYMEVKDDRALAEKYLRYPIILSEVWNDYGDDGHTYFRRVGYVIFPYAEDRPYKITHRVVSDIFEEAMRSIKQP